MSTVTYPYIILNIHRKCRFWVGTLYAISPRCHKAISATLIKDQGINRVMWWYFWMGMGPWNNMRRPQIRLEPFWCVIFWSILINLYSPHIRIDIRALIDPHVTVCAAGAAVVLVPAPKYGVCLPSAVPRFEHLMLSNTVSMNKLHTNVSIICLGCCS
jgi:hypothetical protein